MLCVFRERACCCLSVAYSQSLIASRKMRSGLDPVIHPDRQTIHRRRHQLRRYHLFLLIKGPDKEVGKHVDAFNALVRSAKFIEKKDPKGNAVR